MEYAYYAKLIKDGFHTQCTLDLESGAVKIQDVPFEFRNTEAYEAAHLYARTIKDEKERHDAYWQIQKQLESDIVQCEAEHQWRNGGKHRRQAIMPRDTSCFVLEERTDALMATYDSKLKLPDSLRSIGNLAFSKDEKLTEIDFGHGIKNLGSGENDSIFFLCNALTSIEIPSNVESIGSNAFKGCRNLSNVILNEGLENVGPGAFNGCNLTEITIPKSVKKVHDFSFQGVKRVNIKGILPAYFLHAILKTDNGMQYDDSFNIVEITDGQNKLFFPMYLESDDKSVLQHNLNYKTLAEVVEDENFISKPGEYSKHIEVKQDMAIKIYGHNQDSEIRTYLRRIATNITKRYISKKDEDGLVEFLKFNLMTTTAINKILPQVENAGMTSATAYLLNAINNAGGNQKTFKI